MKEKQTNLVQPENVASDEELRQQTNAILAKTDWGKYWDDVTNNVQQEVEAYDRARRRSLELASQRIIR